MAKQIRLGEFELIVLLGVMQLGSDAYGASVKRLIKQEIGRDISIGALYSTIERLERKGMLTSKLGDPTPQRGGRARSYLRVSSKGEDSVKLAIDHLTIMGKGLDFFHPRREAV